MEKSHSAHRSSAGRCCTSRAIRKRSCCPDTGSVVALEESYNTARWPSCSSAKKNERKPIKLMGKILHRTTPRIYRRINNMPTSSAASTAARARSIGVILNAKSRSNVSRVGKSANRGGSPRSLSTSIYHSNERTIKSKEELGGFSRRRAAQAKLLQYEEASNVTKGRSHRSPVVFDHRYRLVSSGEF